MQSELQNLKNPDGTKPASTIECLANGGGARPSLTDCVEGDAYAVSVVYQFRLLTPILSDVMGDLRIGATSPCGRV